MLEGQHFQNAYVTRDIDQAVEEFSKRADIRQLIQTEVTVDVWTPSGDGTQTNKLAFIWVDNLQYELIQPVSGDVALYSEALPANKLPVFHHICMRVDSWQDFRARVDQQPFPVVLEGGNDALRFLYLDAREFLGHYLEYTCMSDERWVQMGGR